MVKYYSDKTHKYYNTIEEANRAEFEVKEKENLERIKREREERERKEQQEKVAAERKEMAENVEAARKEMVAAQKKYRDALGAFCDKYGSYHTTVTGIDAIPTLFSALNPFKFFE